MSISASQKQHFERIHDDYAAFACGGGYNSLTLKQWFPGVRCVGFDISSTACRGLHHCIVNLSQALKNIAALVRPGGGLFQPYSNDSN